MTLVELAGIFGKFSKCEYMVKSVNYIKCEKNNRQVELKQSLNCRNYGIYVANCVNCNAQYVGQTKNKFSVRWKTIDTLGKNLIF